MTGVTPELITEWVVRLIPAVLVIGMVGSLIRDLWRDR